MPNYLTYNHFRVRKPACKAILRPKGADDFGELQRIGGRISHGRSRPCAHGLGSAAERLDSRLGHEMIVRDDAIADGPE